MLDAPTNEFHQAKDKWAESAVDIPTAPRQTPMKRALWKRMVTWGKRAARVVELA